MRSKSTASGKIQFYNTDIEFNRSIDHNKFMIDESYFDKLVEISKFVSDMSILFPSKIGNTNGYSGVTYSNCAIGEIHRTTNFPGKMEVIFHIGIPVEKIREMKLNILICD